MKEFLGHALFSYGRYIQEIGALFGLQKPGVRLTEDKCRQLALLLKKVDKGVEYLALPASKLGRPSHTKTGVVLDSLKPFQPSGETTPWTSTRVLGL